MFTVTMLPARRGDCLWIEYGPAHAPHRVLIDGGVAATHRALRRRIETLPHAERRFDLLIVSHIDLDHIAGVLELLRDPPDGLAFGDVWFNGWEHLVQAQRLAEDEGLLGAKQGEQLSILLERRGYDWNRAFGGGPVAFSHPEDGLPRRRLPGGLTLTLLSPTYERLQRLLPAWEREIKRAGLEPGRAGAALEGPGHPEEEADEGLLGDTRINIDALAGESFHNDTSRANASSIAVMAEYDGKRCVLAGDAFASDLTASLAALADAEGEDRLDVDALKLSHHGGRKNTSAALLERLRCSRYLFSTDGSYYDHPHPQAVGRALVHGRAAGPPTLLFNYRSDETSTWDDRALFGGLHPYTPRYPDADAEGTLSVDL